jgi:hypothetical protein
MTITTNDVKIMASERLNDDPDGGGFPTATTVQDNVENNLFPDVSTLDRAQGAMDFRKVYPSVLSNNSDVYYGAHIIVDDMPADPNISAVIVAGASMTETRAELIAANLWSKPFYGIKPLLADAAVDASQVNVGSLTVRFIPSTAVGTSASGDVATSSSGVRSVFYPFTGTETFGRAILPGTPGVYHLYAKWPGLPTSASGAFSATKVSTSEAKTDGVISSLASGYMSAVISFTVGGGVLATTNSFQGAAAFRLDPNATDTNVTAATATYTPMVRVNLPVETELTQYTSAMSPVVNLALDFVPEIGSEAIDWIDTTGIPRTMTFANGGTSTTGPFSSNATVDRAGKSIIALLDPAPKVNTDIKVTYCRSGYITSITAPASFTDIDCVVTLAANTTLAAGRFSIGGLDYMIRDNTVYRWDPLNGITYTWIVGSYNPTTKTIRIPELGLGTHTITNWKMAAVSTLFPTSGIDGGTIPANLNPATLTLSGKKSPSGTAWTSSSDVNGAFSDSLLTGSYNKTTGQLTLSFSEPVSSSMTYASTLFTYTPVGASVTGVDPAPYASNGEVPIFKVGNIVVIHNTVTRAPVTAVNGGTVATRADIADARVIGSDGVEITSGFTVNKATGLVTFTNVTGWANPVTVKDRIEDLCTLTAATPAGLLTLSKPLNHAYTSGVSFVSSAYDAKDLQGRAHPGFQQQTWTGVWSDSIIGAGISADYNEAAYPFVMTNKGAVKERWALIFTSTAGGVIVGEQVGQIGVFSTSTTTAPNNPMTGSPYFTIDPLGWGSGWSNGNVYRFNTDGAQFPAWFIRSINPSDPFVGQDKATMAVRGDINA